LNFKDKTVLVTGADGFIGSHLTERLSHSGAKVTALTLYNSFDQSGWLDDISPDLKADVTIIRGDIRDPHQMNDVCKGQEIVFHLASLIAIPFSYEAPGNYIDTNVQGTLNIMMSARAAGCQRIIHTSTSEVYGTAQFTPITEDHPLQAQSPYSASKIGADMIAQSHFLSFGLPVITLRPFNTYGPRQSERAVISATIRQALDERCQSIRLGDLSPKRDFNFVQDTVSAFIHTASADQSHHGQVFNAGSGRMVSIQDVVYSIKQITGCNKEIVQEPSRIRPQNSEVMTLMADSSKLHDATGWTPKVTLEQGLSETVKWWQDRLPQVRANSDYIT